MLDLDPKTWKNISAKFKVKDNGLEKALSTYNDLEDDDHDECLKTITLVNQLANTLKKAKEAAAAPAVLKYLNDLSKAAESEKSDVTKAKAAAAKAQEVADKAQIAADKAKSAADKAEASQKKDEEEDEGKDDEADPQEGGLKPLLVSMLQKVKTARPDAPYQYLLCDAKPFPYVMIAKQINASHKKLLEKASGGSKRFLKPGTITFEDGHYCFTSEKDIPGYTKRVQGFLKNLTGKKVPVMFGTQKAADEEDSNAGQEVEEEAGTSPRGGVLGGERGAAGAAGEAAGDGGKPAAPASADEPLLNKAAPFAINASVGNRGKNKPEDVQAVQAALNKSMRAGLTVDGKCGPSTIAAIKAFQQTLGKFKPDGLVEVGRGTARALAKGGPAGPPPEPLNPVAPPQLGKGTLDKAPDAWRGMHGILGKNVGELKRAVRSEYASEHPTLVKDIEEGLKKLDVILQNIGGDLADHLAEANAAKDAAVRKAKLQQCKAMVAKHIMYVKSEPLIAHIDKNPFGVATNFQKIVTDHLVHVAQAIGKVG